MDISPEQRNALAWLSESAYKDAEWRLKSSSGQDQSESQIYLEESRVYQAIIRGEHYNLAIHQSRIKFRLHVQHNNVKVNSYPKIKSGPREGQSWIEHKWLDCEAFDRRINKIIFRVNKAMSDPEHVRVHKGWVEGYASNRWYPLLGLGEVPSNVYPSLEVEMKWSDQQRAQLLQIYKDKIDSLGEEKFFDQFDQIREEAYKTMGIEIVAGTEKDFLPTTTYIPRDNRPYAVNCTDGKGILQSHLAEGYIISPTGRRIGAMCKACAQVVIDEYQTKLGQTWTFEPQDWQPVTQEQIKVGVEGRGLHQLAEMGTYVDPIHTSAATLGRLGGKVKSEAKTTSSRSNGKKGGRPSVKQLDLEEI